MCIKKKENQVTRITDNLKCKIREGSAARSFSGERILKRAVHLLDFLRTLLSRF